MILFRKRTIRLVPFYLLYMAAVLAASSLYGLYAAESEEIVAQVFGDRVYCYLLVPPFIWTISTIDGSTKKPSFIRMKSISPVSASSTIPVRSYISNYMVFHDLYFGNLAW